MINYILVGLASIGILETIYLLSKRLRKQEPACIIGDACSIVLGSKYSKTLGIHNDILGLVFYIAILALVLIETQLLIPLAIIGSLSSLYFTYIQFFKIKSWCFWCLMSALNTWLILAVITLL